MRVKVRVRVRVRVSGLPPSRQRKETMATTLKVHSTAGPNWVRVRARARARVRAPY